MTRVAAGMFTCLADAAETSSTPLRQGMGNVLFTIVFILLVIAGVIWWLKRNYG